MNNKNNNYKYPYKRGCSWRKRTVEKDVRRRANVEIKDNI